MGNLVASEVSCPNGEYVTGVSTYYKGSGGTKMAGVCYTCNGGKRICNKLDNDSDNTYDANGFPNSLKSVQGESTNLCNAGSYLTDLYLDQDFESSPIGKGIAMTCSDGNSYGSSTRYKRATCGGKMITGVLPAKGKYVDVMNFNCATGTAQNTRIPASGSSAGYSPNLSYDPAPGTLVANNTPLTGTPQNNSIAVEMGSNHTLLFIILIVIVVIVAAIAAYYYSSGSSAHSSANTLHNNAMYNNIPR